MRRNPKLSIINNRKHSPTNKHVQRHKDFNREKTKRFEFHRIISFKGAVKKILHFSYFQQLKQFVCLYRTVQFISVCSIKVKHMLSVYTCSLLSVLFTSTSTQSSLFPPASLYAPNQTSAQQHTKTRLGHQCLLKSFKQKNMYGETNEKQARKRERDMQASIRVQSQCGPDKSQKNA